VQQQQPNNKEEGPPRPLGKEATTGGEHRDFDKDSLSHCLQTLAELKVLQYLKLLVSPHVTEDRGADKYSLIAVVIASKAVPDSVDPSDHSKTPSRISKEMFEGTTHDMSVGKGAMDQFQGIHWRKGVGMKERPAAACSTPLLSPEAATMISASLIPAIPWRQSRVRERLLPSFHDGMIIETCGTDDFSLPRLITRTLLVHWTKSKLPYSVPL